MNTLKTKTTWPEGAETTVFSGAIIDKAPQAAEWVKAALFGEDDDLHCDVFDEKTSMQIKLSYRADGVELSAPQLAGTEFRSSAFLAISDIDEESSEEFAAFVKNNM